jgi:hypothetical protein
MFYFVLNNKRYLQNCYFLMEGEGEGEKFLLNDPSQK